MKVLFLSQKPHQVHLSFAKKIGANIKITKPLNKIAALEKESVFARYTYPFFAFLYSLTQFPKEEVLFPESSSALYVAAFIKMRSINKKIIYLDNDLFIKNSSKASFMGRKINNFLISKIDGIISVSSINKKEASKITKVPILICPPYPKKIKKIKTKRKNYGLYVGRIDADKNINRIINFSIQCPFLKKLIIIGEGSLEKHVKKISEKYPKIVFLGSKKDPSKYYNLCKFLIHIPDVDPHPCTTMEAAIAGCFPIMSEGVGSKYLFDKLFIIKNPDNFREINAKINFILNNEEKAKKLLEKSLVNIPTEKESLFQFQKAFNNLLNKMK